MIPAPPTKEAEEMAYTFAYVSVVLNVISFLLFIARVCSRSLPVFRMGWDDYLIVPAWVSDPSCNVTRN
jgi:hypothetical protein